MKEEVVAPDTPATEKTGAERHECFFELRMWWSEEAVVYQLVRLYNSFSVLNSFCIEKAAETIL